jgi:aminobenzoyl-glutamate utilization protein B
LHENKEEETMFRLHAWLFGAIAFLLAASSLQATGKLTKEKQTALSWLDGNRDAIVSWADSIWTYAETSLQEHRSSEVLAKALEQNGFRVERGVAGMPTAFVATYGSGRPVIGVLAEFDALPGLSQRAEPTKAPRIPGAPGHGCGHNLFGAASVSAAIAAKEAMEKHGVNGTIKVFGSPAEETVIGKVYMARDGIFDGLDAVLDWHPSDSTRADYGSSLAMNSFQVTFFGKTAHGAGDPWKGRSALDAVELMDAGVNFYREHIKPTARIHYVITDGGKAPNVVPDRAQVWYYVRDLKRSSVEEMYERLLDIAKGAALMTGTTYEVNLITGVHEVLGNEAGARIIDANLRLVGPPQFTPEELEFARQIQKEAGVEPKGMHSGIGSLEEGAQGSRGSTDVAEVSWLAPTARLRVATAPIDVPWHSWAVVATGGMEIGHKGMMVAAKTLALSAIDLLTQPKLLAGMQEEWQEKTAGKPYRSPIPKDKKPPVVRTE